jgi:WD40 repeat protein
MLRNLRLASILLVALAPRASAAPAPAPAPPWPSIELRDRQAGSVEGVAFTLDGRFLASADNSGMVIVRMFPGPRVFSTLQGGGFSDVAWATDGRKLVAGGLDRLVYIWKPPYMDPPRMLPFPGPVEAVALTPEGVILAVGGREQTIHRWHMPVMEELAPFRGHTADIYTVRVSPDGQTVVSGGEDRTLRVWEASGRQSIALHGYDDRVNDLAFSPDGAVLAAAYGDGTLMLWNARTWRLQRLVHGPPTVIRRVAVSRGGWLAGAGADHAVWIWAPGDTLPTLALRGHRGKVNAVAFSPNGFTLASAGSDTTVRLWTVP